KLSRRSRAADRPRAGVRQEAAARVRSAVPETTLTALLRHRVERHPDRLLLIHEGRRWSYEQFRAESERFAAALQRLGVKKGDKIALFLPNCPEFLFAVFAATRIGAVFVPLNTAYTAEEAEYV